MAKKVKKYPKRVKILESKAELKRAAAAALDFANKIRTESGLKPLKRLPKGEQCDGENCPLSKAICPSNKRSDEIQSIDTGGRNVLLQKVVKTRINIPQTARAFVKAFDDGKYPHLIG